MPSTSLVVDRYVLAAAVVLTCVLFTAKAADPVNVIKLTALMLCALVLLGSTVYRIVRHRIASVPVGPGTWAAGGLLLAFVVTTLAAPVTTTAVLGTYGRNSGLLAYGSALVLFLAALRVLGPPQTRVLLAAVVVAGLFTATYGLLQRAGIDAIPWNNPFNPVIAALGNPNFASGYMGITASVAAGGALWKGWPAAWRAASAATALLSLAAAAASNSVQGPIAAAAGLFVVALGWSLDLDTRLRRRAVSGLLGAAAVGVIALVAGAVTKAGPIGAVFTDYGSRARVYYWDAALSMFAERPLVGVGLDHYGSFWRSSRSPGSVTFLGGGSFSDAAHSVPLQMLAQGGVLLGLAYLGLLGVVAVALVRGLLRLSGADRMLLAAVGGGWAAYQVQSFVSIDQVPLIVLHFSLAGAVLAAAGAVRLREVRLPGALQPPKTAPNDARAKRRVAAAAPPRRRPVAVADVAVLSIAALGLAFLAWQSLSPLRANIAVQRGDKALAAGQGNAALDAFKQATDLVPGQPVYWGRQAQLFSQVKQPDLARSAYDEAAEVDPFDVNALRNAAAAAEEAGELPRAERLFRRAAELDPLNPETLVAAATYGLRHSGAEWARELLEGPVLELPDDAGLWATLGDARAVLGDAAGARKAYERALELTPGQPTATEGLQKLAAAT